MNNDQDTGAIGAVADVFDAKHISWIGGKVRPLLRVEVDGGVGDSLLIDIGLVDKVHIEDSVGSECEVDMPVVSIDRPGV